MGTSKLSDRQLATLLGVVLFVGAAWPLLLVGVPPYQDFWGHLATTEILAHPEKYPEYVATGFFKTNGALSAFLFFVGRLVGLVTAARLLAAGVLAAAAFVLPRFVLHFGGRDRMVVASFVAWPMVHNWYVAMGMLNFALSVPCALTLLVLLDRHRVAPSPGRAVAAAIVAVVTWYVHGFALIIVGVLLLVYVASRGRVRSAWRDARTLLPPLVPAGLLLLISTVRHLTTLGSNVALASDHAEFEPAVWALYDLWAHWTYGFTLLSASTLVAAAALGFWTVRSWRDAPPLFGPWPTAALLAAVFFCPYMAIDAGFLSSRFIPFFWMAALTRVPARLARPWAAVLGAAALLYWVGNGVDVLRLDREQREFGAGTSVVPEGARVLFFNFSPRLTSRNTWSLQTATGQYVVARHTNAFDIWPSGASQAIVRRATPRRVDDPAVLRRFLEGRRTRAAFCAAQAASGDPLSCDALWRAEWDAFWRDARPEYTHVLMWDPTDDVRAQLPPDYALRFHAGRLWIWSRDGG